MNMDQSAIKENNGLSLEDFRKEVLNDYSIGWLSRNLSITGRKEVLTGKAKFGIFGDGKEVAQIAFAKQFRNGDWRSGYYRDQTFMMAAGLLTAKEFFAQLYGETEVNLNPGNAGRSFNNHFSTRSINQDGTWRNLADQKNSSADISPTAGQMPRLLGLAYASKIFRDLPSLHGFDTLTDKGNEVAFGTIGDASTSEGHFWETINAAAVLQVPVALAIWDDGYGISVPKKIQTAKGSISKILAGFERDESDPGIVLLKGKGWDYPGLCKLFAHGVQLSREEHVPVVFHIDEMTQPLGHSTSGSHERYKSAERLKWEEDNDPLKKMREWIISAGLGDPGELDRIEEQSMAEAKKARKEAFNDYIAPMVSERDALLEIIDGRSCMCKKEGIDKISEIAGALKRIPTPIRKDNFSTARKILRHVCSDCDTREQLQKDLSAWLDRNLKDSAFRYNTFLYNESRFSALKVTPVAPLYNDNSPKVPGREILRDFWDKALEREPRLFIFGQDTGKIGGVNQSYEGLQDKYGKLRVTDTGIRETTILGQAIGMALRGMRPVAEIQYLDYLLYALQTFSDDLATTHYRTRGGQSVPAIVITRGHRLEGIWHAGSPVSMIINSIRGVYVCVPRNMTQAAGFYNTLLDGQDPAIVIEPLNGYRLKEKRPDNMGEYKIPLGTPEILTRGNDITIVTYGSCVRIALDAVKQLKEFNISAELIDVQTLLPFDLHDTVLDSLKKTGKVLFFDEDVPGGATSYMLQQVLDERGGFFFLDAEPRTLTGKDHRTAYTSDGGLFLKSQCRGCI
jgi:2-oxoisovalerate dehydrogenase E1 component